MQPRFRVFAGPNGSGKTHLFNYLHEQGFIHTEFYVNADAIEKKLSASLSFHFNAYHVKVSEEEFKLHILKSGILKKIKDKTFIDKIKIEKGILKINIQKKELNSYIASFIASYLAEKLIESGQSFCFETVFSHPSKIKLLDLANKNGYKTYLYFVFTDNWKLNIERVKLRVRQGGHYVDEKKVEERYFKSLQLFSTSAKSANSSFLIDNSISFDLMAEMKNGKSVFTSKRYPMWLKKYYVPDTLK